MSSSPGAADFMSLSHICLKNSQFIKTYYRAPHESHRGGASFSIDACASFYLSINVSVPFNPLFQNKQK